ncbi:MAG TPA: biotin/lipoyl-containing protein [Terriglobales bacterium]|nr:biotin/lipoyl-containing protein [Terriglobales bacterium]
MIYDVMVDGKRRRVELKALENAGAGASAEDPAQANGRLERGSRKWRVLVDGREVTADAVAVGRDMLSLLIGGRSYEVFRDATITENGAAEIRVRGRRFLVEVRDPRALRSRRAAAGHADGPRRLLAPMPGKVIRVLAPVGAKVEAGEGVLVIEAMKMQNELKSPKAGTVSKIAVSEGAAVNAGDVLAVVE